MLLRGSCWSRHPLNHIYLFFFKIYIHSMYTERWTLELKETIWRGMEIAARPAHHSPCPRQTLQAVAFCRVSEQSTLSWFFFLNRILSLRLHTVNLSLHAYLERARQVFVTTLNSPVKVGVPASCECLALAEEVTDSGDLAKINAGTCNIQMLIKAWNSKTILIVSSKRMATFWHYKLSRVTF